MSNSTRSSSSNSYDERFVVPLEASRRGAHRARVSPVMAAVPVVAVVGIVVGAIGLVYFFFGGLNGSEAGTDPSTAASPPASSAPSVVATPTPSGSDVGATTDSPSPGAAAGAVDKTITIDVYNGTSPVVSGLARTAATKLTKAGWTTGQVETWTKAAVTGTTIFYGTAEQKATAQALAKTLGRGVAKLSASKAGTGITVVIGNDFPGATGTRKTTKNPATSSSTRTAGGSTATTTRTTRTTATPDPSVPADIPSPTPTN